MKTYKLKPSGQFNSKAPQQEKDAAAWDPEAMVVSVVTQATATSTTNCSVKELLKGIAEGTWAKPVEEIRLVYERAKTSGADPKKSVKPLKKKLPAAMFSGQFASRSNGALISHSGLLCADLDDVNADLEEVFGKLKTSPYAYSIFRSPTGTGLKALFRMKPDRAAHHGSFLAMKAHIKEMTGYDIDGQCKDVARLCFVSYDPNLWCRADEPQELYGCTQSTHKTDTVVLSGVCGASALSTASSASVASVCTIDAAVEIATPRNSNTNHKNLCKFAGALRAYEENTRRKLTPKELKSAFEKWYDRSSRFLNPENHKDEYYFEFLDAWENIARPLSESQLDVAWNRALKSPNPPEAAAHEVESTKLRLMISFCRELQLLSGNEAFYLSPYSVMRFFGQSSASTAAKWLRALRVLKILTLVKKGNFLKREASSYRFNFQTN